MNHPFSSSTSALSSVLLTSRKASTSVQPAEPRDTGAEFREAMNDAARSKAAARADASRHQRADDRPPVSKPHEATHRAEPRIDDAARAAKPAHADKPAHPDKPMSAEKPVKSEAVSKRDGGKPATAPEGATKETEELNGEVAAAGLAGQPLPEQTLTELAAKLVGDGELAEDPLSGEGDEQLTGEILISPLAAIHGLPTDPAGAAAIASGTGLPPLAGVSDPTALAQLQSKMAQALKNGELTLSVETKPSPFQSSPEMGMESEANLMELQGEFSLEELQSPFSRLLAANSAANGKEAQLLNPDQSLTKLVASTPAQVLEAASRPADIQAPANRGFVVQTGVPMTMGQPRWGEAVGERVLWLAAQNVSSAELRLDPPELGPMQVRVTIQNDQATVSFSSPHPQVREALDQSAARLREMFSEQGLNLTNMDVSDQSFARQQAKDEENNASGKGGDADMDDDEALVGTTTDIARLRLVDHYA